MLGKNKKLEQIQQHEIVQEPINPLDSEIKEINKTLEGVNLYLKEIAKVSGQLASRIETLEGVKQEPHLKEITETKRISGLEQNVLSHQTVFESLSINIQKLDSDVNGIKQILSKVIEELQERMIGFGQDESVSKKKKSKKKKQHVKVPSVVPVEAEEEY